MEVQRIPGKEGIIVTREKLPLLIETPCLEVCQILYDKNIRTVASNGNLEFAILSHQFGVGTRGLFVHIDYDSLDNRNKQIAAALQKQGLVKISRNQDCYGGIKTKVILQQKPVRNLAFDLTSFMAKLNFIGQQFVVQDVLYGHETPQMAIRQILDAQHLTTPNAAYQFLQDNQIVTCDHVINIANLQSYLQTLPDTVFIDDSDTSYRTINFGKVYDPVSGEFWVNQELLTKHQEFVRENCLSR